MAECIKEQLKRIWKLLMRSKKDRQIQIKLDRTRGDKT